MKEKQEAINDNKLNSFTQLKTLNLQTLIRINKFANIS